MNRIVNIMVWITLLMWIIPACTPTIPDDVEIIESPAQPPTQESLPASTAPSATETSVVAPTIGPAMELGSTYNYVDGTLLVAVPAGEFLMGANGADNPEHKVSLRNYWIYSTMVTNQQYSLCESMGKCTEPDRGDNPDYTDRMFANHPVVGVTHEQAREYCSFVHGRLPTEAEWEKSARSLENDDYPWGDVEPSCDLLNFGNCVGSTTNVVNYKSGASPYGVLDMSGNAFEWVADWYDANYYDNSQGENPQGPAIGTLRTVRSSGYSSVADRVAVMIRNAEDPHSHRPDLGFRCVVDEPTYFAPFCSAPLTFGSESHEDMTLLETCPVLDIAQAQYCVGKLPLTNVTFTGPTGATINSSNCTPSENPNLFTCQSPGTVVSITAKCKLNEPGTPLCPDGFIKMNNTCVADGASGQCLAGNYDSSQQCCYVPSEQSDVLSFFQICPVGTFYTEGENTCLPYPVKEIISLSLNVGFSSCDAVGSGGGAKDDGESGSGSGGTCCQEPVGGCGLSEFWDPVQCCCTHDGITCSYKPSCP